MPRDEVEAAYFTLLRAREELDALRRYQDYLGDESRRLARVTREGEALRAGIDRRLLRPLAHTDRPMADAITARSRAIADERDRLPERLEAAEAFVADCETEHAQLRDRR